MSEAEKSVDVEQMPQAEAHLLNATVKNISFRGVNVIVKDRETKKPRAIVDNVSGVIHAGEICALMGPSGCGKTTLLNVLARRPTNASSVEGEVLINGSRLSTAHFREITSFVEQEDALIGALTVRETLEFSSRLASSSSSLSRHERQLRVDSLLSSFGLVAQASTLIGTPLRKGISGGQKRRVGIASQLITSPKILFLDEPTSGLDSVASWEVINHLRAVARRNNLIVICSIHQPSTSTFNLFDKLMLLSGGKLHYSGPREGVVAYYESVGHSIPQYVNPAEFVLELLNIDFVQEKNMAAQRLEQLHSSWLASPQAEEMQALVSDAEHVENVGNLQESTEKKPNLAGSTMTLLHRSFIKGYRDFIAYGIRIVMYTGLATMMGTVWLRMETTQAYIQQYSNALFFGSAFMSFMAVAYVPAFLEDRSMYIKERRNGLYGATELVVSNFFIGIPFLFFMVIIFSVIAYWLCNFQSTALAFFTWIMWLFFNLLAAESLVVFLTSLFPSFVIALALAAFANGLWMCIGGFMVPPTYLNVFYKYVLSYWDYQKYIFEGMMVNEFSERVFSCGSDCRCIYDSPLADQCQIPGQAVLDLYGYAPGRLGRNVGITIAITFGYRFAAWLVLRLRKS